jgi:phosphoglycerate kinase
MNSIRYVDQMDLDGKRVLLRVDLNVPLRNGVVADDSRILAVLPTIEHIIGEGGMPIITSHLDRPGGKRVPELSLRPVSERLSELTGDKVAFVDEVTGPKAEAAASSLKEGSMLMLENLRFDPGEEVNDESFARSLASLADAYVDDAFANAHRAHASNVGVTRFIDDVAGGLLMKMELQALEGVLVAPERPLVVAIGGAKVSSKIATIEHLSKIADRLLLGGAMAFPFLRAKGIDVGDHRADGEAVERAKRMLDERPGSLVLPEDFAVDDGGRREVDVTGLPEDMNVLDIGPRTIDKFASELKAAGTIVWNGPMGKFEEEGFDVGTRMVAKAISASPAYSLVGGGDTNAALDRYEVRDRISYVSTGGGAFLEMLSGRELPAVKALVRQTVND